MSRTTKASYCRINSIVVQVTAAHYTVQGLFTCSAQQTSENECPLPTPSSPASNSSVLPAQCNTQTCFFVMLLRPNY